MPRVREKGRSSILREGRGCALSLLAPSCVSVCRVVESESVESHVFSWSRESDSFFQNCWSRSRESDSFFLNCWSRSRAFKNVGVGFLKLSESVFQNCWSRNPKKYSDSTTLSVCVSVAMELGVQNTSQSLSAVVADNRTPFSITKLCVTSVFIYACTYFPL